MKIFAALSLSLLLFSTRAIAAEANAQQLLSQAEEAFALAEFDRALELLGDASDRTGDRKLLAAIFRQEGLVQEILQRPALATLSFVRALRCDAAVSLAKAENKRSVLQIFELARAMHRSGVNASELGTQLSRPLGNDLSACGGPSIDPGQALSLSTPLEPPRAEKHGPGWGFWVTGVTAVAAAAVGVTFGVLAANKDSECRAERNPALYDQCDKGARTLETGANVSYAVAGVAALSAGGLFLAASF